MSTHKVPVVKSSTYTTVEEQNSAILNEVVELVQRENQNFSGTRLVTIGAAKTVAARALEKTENESYSVRRHQVFTEVSHYISLAQRNRVMTASAQNTDLLPIAHPRSTKDHNLSLASVLELRSRWITDDPEITDTTVKTLLASALTSHPSSPEYEYSIARLEAMPQGSVPKYALVAAFGDGNSSAARRARAMLQRRDRYGRFAEMGGGIRALIRRAKGIFNLNGRVVAEGISRNTFDMELPDGRIARVPAENVEAVKAYLPQKRGSDGYSPKPAKVSASDPIIDEADIEFVDAPDGFREDTAWQPSDDDRDYYGDGVDLGKKYTDDAYDVVKFDAANAPAKDKFEAVEQREGEGQNALAFGAGPDGELDPDSPVFLISRRDGNDRPFGAVQSWADAQALMRDDEPRYRDGDRPDPNGAGAGRGDDRDGQEEGTFETPEGETVEGEVIPALRKPTRRDLRDYRRRMKDFEKGKGLFPLDPRKDHLVADDGRVIDLENGEVVFDPRPRRAKVRLAPDQAPQNFWDFDRKEKYKPEGATRGQESPDYTDDPSEIAQRFDEGDIKDALRQSVVGNEENPATGVGPLEFEEGDEPVPAEALYEALKEKGSDADEFLDNLYRAPEDRDPNVDQDERESLEPVPAAPEEPAEDKVPPLLEGLGDEEREKAMSGDLKDFLPKNEVDDAPDGYAELDPEPFNAEDVVLPENAPDNFSMNPVDIANNYEGEDLKNELRRSLEPGNDMPGFGALGAETPEGEDFVGRVPGEAIRDALQLQGEDTNQLIDDIYNEGREGQGEPDAQEVQDALEGENVEEREAEAPQQPEADAEGPAPAKREARLPADSQAPEGEGDAKEPEGGQEADLAIGEAHRARIPARDLQPGDIAVRDNEFFVIEEVGAAPDVSNQDDKKRNRVEVKGYYPGHRSQDRDWWANGEIEVIRNVAPPAKGDKDPLPKPDLKDYGRMQKVDGEWLPRDLAERDRYIADMAAHKAAVEAAGADFFDPTKVDDAPEAPAVDKPEDGPFIAKFRAEDLQPGDIGNKDYFKIVDVRPGEGKDEDKMIIVGHYPGLGLQEKKWKKATPIEVIRGIPEEQGPEQGEGSLHRPAGRGPKGGWFPDDDTKANQEHQEKLAEAKARWNPPENLPVVSPIDAKGENKLEENPEPPKPPFIPNYQPFRGRFAEMAREAGGDWAKFKELVDGEEIIVFDFETTGISVSDGNEPYQLAAYKIRNGEVVDKFIMYFNPGRPLKGTYAEKNAVGPDGGPLPENFFDDKPSQQEALAQFLEWAGENPLMVAQNARFDDEILQRKAAEFGLKYEPGGIADTLAMAKQFDGVPGRAGLGNLAKWLDVELEKWHNAEFDALATAEVFKALIQKGIDENNGLNALDVDAMDADFERREAAAQPKIEAFKQAAADWLAAQILRKGLQGEDVNLADVGAVPAGVPEGPVNEIGRVGAPDQIRKPRADLVDVEVDSAFPDGRMKIADPDFINDPDNFDVLMRGEIKVEELRPGDFVRPNRDKDEFFQVVAIAAGDEFGVEEFKRRVLFQNKDGQQKVVFWNQNAWLDEVRRPKDRAALAAQPSEKSALEEAAEKAPAQPEMADGEVRGVATNLRDVKASIQRDGDGYVARVSGADDAGNEVNFEGVLPNEEAAQDYIKNATAQANKDLKGARGEEAKEPSFAVGQEPANINEIPQVEHIDDLPFGKGENEISARPEGEEVVYNSKAKLIDDDGVVVAQEEQDFPDRQGASDGGREAIEREAEKFAEEFMAQRDELLLRSEGRNFKNLPPIPEKYRRQVYIRILHGLYADSDGNPLAIGDRVRHIKPNMAQKWGDGVVIGKVQGPVGGLQRKGVVYVDYAVIRYDDGRVEKRATRNLQHIDGDLAKRRFDEEPRINWMNEEQMKEALVERAKKPRKGGKEEIDAADEAVEEIVQDVKNVIDGVVPEPEEGQEAEKPRYEFNIAWFKENVEPQKMKVADLRVGDFMPTKGDKNIGRIIAIEDLDKAARIKVEFPEGRTWEYGPYNKNFELSNIYRLDGGKPESSDTPEAPAADAPEPSEPPQGPQAPEAVEPEAPEAPEEPKAGDPFVDLDDEAAIVEKLKAIRANMPNFRNNRRDRGARWAGREIDRLLENIAAGEPIDRRSNLRYVREALRYGQGIRDPKDLGPNGENNVAQELQKLYDNILAKRDAIAEKRKNDFLERMRQGEADIPAINEADLNPQNLQEALAAIKNVLPTSQEEEVDWSLKRAANYVAAIQNRAERLGDGDFDLLDLSELDRAIEYIRDAELDKDLQNVVADKFQAIRDSIKERAAKDRAVRHAKYIERLNQPIDDDIFPNAENLGREKVQNAVDAVLNILPQREERDAPDNLYRAADLLRDYREQLERRDPDGIGRWEFSRAIENLRRDGDPRQEELAQKLEDLQNLIDANAQKFKDQRLADYKKRLAKPFDENLVVGDPDALDKQGLIDIFQEMVDRLPQDNEVDADRQAQRAAEAAKAALRIAQDMDDDDAGFRALDVRYLEAVIRRLGRLGESDEKPVADFAEKALELITAKKNKLKGEARDRFLARRNQDLPENLVPEEGRESKQDFLNLVDAVIERLPKDKDEEEDNDPIEALAKLRSARDSIFEAKDPLTAGQKEIGDAIRLLNRADDDKYKEFGALLEELGDFAQRRIIERPVPAFAGVNLEERDPIEIAEQRVAANENAFAGGEKVRALLADDETFNNNLFLRPFKERLQEFFRDGQARPMAALDIRERQALGQFVAERLANNRGKDKELGAQLVDLALALHAERDFYQPQRDSLGEVGERLRQIDAAKFFRAANAGNRRGWSDLVIDGQDTGFEVKRVGTGINSSRNFFVRDKATGQRFLFKQEQTEQAAIAEAEAARVIAALGMAGRVWTERHPTAPDVIIQTFAGDALRLIGGPEDFGDAQGKGLVGGIDDAARRAAMVDLVRLGILDAVINNTDRHGSNFKWANADVAGVQGNGYGDGFIIPFDHGFAAGLNDDKARNVIPANDFALSSHIGRTGGSIVHQLGKQIGADSFKQLMDMSVQQALQYLEALEPGQMRPEKVEQIKKRLQAIQGISVDTWKREITGGR